jgi:2Fe-2S ferredoxin
MRETKLTVGSLIPGNIVALQKQKVVFHEPKQKIKRERRIHLLQNQSAFTIQPVKGQLLLDTALKQGKDLKYKCRKGTCGVCTVKVLEGASFLGPTNDKEQKKLKTAIYDSYRLACQALIKD